MLKVFKTAVLLIGFNEITMIEFVCLLVGLLTVILLKLSKFGENFA